MDWELAARKNLRHRKWEHRSAKFLSRLLGLGLLIFGLFWLAHRLLVRFPAIEARLDSRDHLTSIARHQKQLNVDLHIDAPLWPRRDLNIKNTQGHFDFPRMLNGNLGGGIFFIPADFPAGMKAWDDLYSLSALWDSWSRVRYLRDRFATQARNWNAKYPDKNAQARVYLAKSPADWLEGLIRFRRGRGPRPFVFGLEGAASLAGDVSHRLNWLKQNNILVVGPIHLIENVYGGANFGGREAAGLTLKGRRVLGELERAGFIVDLAHASEQSFRGALKILKKPFLVTHTGFQGVHPGSRNLADWQIRAIARRGGLVGLMLSEMTAGEDNLEIIYKQLEYFISRAGEDYITIGSDMDGYVKTTVDTNNLWQLTAYLEKKGYSRKRIAKIMGRNLETFLERWLRTVPVPD